MTPWASIRLTWAHLSLRQKLAYFAILAAQLTTNFFDLLGIAAVGLLVMAVASGSIDFDLAGIYRVEVEETSPGLILMLVAIAAVAFLVKALFNLGLSLVLVRYMAAIEVKKSKEIAEYLLSGTLGNLRRYSRADIQYAVNSSTSSMFSGILTALASIFTGGGLMLVILATFVAVNPTAAIAVSVYLIAVILVIQFVISGRLRRVGQNVNEGSVATNGSILDAIRSFRELAVLRKQDFFISRFVEARWLLARTKATTLILNSVPRIIIEQGLMIGVLGFVTWQVMTGDVAEGLASIGVFVVGSVRIIGAVIPVQNAFANLKTTVVKAEMAQTLLREAESTSSDMSLAKGPMAVSPALKNSGSSLRDKSRGLSVELQDVSFSYPNGDLPAVTDISLEAAPGGFIAFIGPSGSGKTTLADLVLGLNVPDSGTVLIEGRSPLEIRQDYPGLITYVPQKPGMVSGSIAQNVALGISDENIDEGRVWECLRIASLDNIVSQMAGGIHASLGKQSDQLSGGQLQRLGLARALYPDPKLIILDEATSALDAASEAEISRNIRGLGEKVTLIVIAHRLSTVQHADCVYVVNEGKIIGAGPFLELRRSVPLVEEYVRLMSFEDPKD